MEDEAVVRELTRRVLLDLGYRVMIAAEGEEALRLAADPTVEIDLLVSDVIMPGMNGKQLYEKLCERRPGLRVIFMSGYTSNILSPIGVTGPGTRLLQKPFSLSELAVAVRLSLDGRLAA